MSEDEATEKLKELVARCKECKFATCENCEINWNEVQAIKTILDLYQKEKEKNKRNKKIMIDKLDKLKNGVRNDFPITLGKQQPLWEDNYTNYISKDKIKEKLEYATKMVKFYTTNEPDHILIPIYNEVIKLCKELLEEER